MGKQADTPMPQAGELTPTGKVRKTYGPDGALLIELYDNFPAAVADEDNYTEPLWVIIDSLAVPLFVSTFELQNGRTRAVVRFDDFGTPAEAGMLTGLKLYTRHPDEVANGETGEYAHLVGYRVTAISEDDGTQHTGAITAFHDYPHNPLLEADFGSTGLHEVLLPVNDALIEQLDRKRRTLTLRAAGGLFSL